MLYDGKYPYEVIFVDEYNNFYEIGFFSNLRDAEPLLNEHLKGYTLCEDDDIDPGHTPRFGDGPEDNLGILKTYASTYGECFDRMIPVEEGCVEVRGFVRGKEQMQ